VPGDDGFEGREEGFIDRAIHLKPAGAGLCGLSLSTEIYPDPFGCGYWTDESVPLLGILDGGEKPVYFHFHISWGILFPRQFSILEPRNHLISILMIVSCALGENPQSVGIHSERGT
jgi:hypothetical protein